MSKKSTSKKSFAIIYHSGDADGILSAMLLSEVMHSISNTDADKEYNFEFFGYNFEKDIKFEKSIFENEKFTDIIFTDVTPPEGWIAKNSIRLNNTNMKLWIFDHHKNAYDKLSIECQEINHVEYVFDNSKSASKIVYDTFWTNENIEVFEKMFETEFSNNNLIEENQNEIKELVKEINDFDIWNWWEPFVETGNAIPFISYWGLYATFLDLAKIENRTVNEYLQSYNSILFLEEFIEAHRKTITEIGDKKFKDETYFSKKITILEKTHPKFGTFCIVGSKTNSFATLRTEREFQNAEFIIYYSINSFGNPEEFKLSLRSIDLDVDVVEKANKMFRNGGGHKNAGGAVCNIVDFFNIINGKTEYL